MFKRLTIISAFIMASISGMANADIAIIAHPELDADNIDTDNIRNLYLGERASFPNGMPAEPINHAKGSPDREQFFTDVLSMSEKSHRRHWKRMQATRSVYQPKEVSSYDDLLDSVANTPGAIGYINSDAVDDSVKVLMTVKSLNDV